MFQLNGSRRGLARAVFFFVTSVSARAGLIDVTPTITTSGAFTHYAYAIANNTASDLFLVDIPVMKGPGAIINLVAPAGFQKQYDSVLGLVSFLEDTAFFTSTPKTGFSFDSLIKPTAVTFQGTLLGATVFTLTGPTMSAATPEPGTLSLFALAAVALAPLARRRIRR